MTSILPNRLLFDFIIGFVESFSAHAPMTDIIFELMVSSKVPFVANA